jgi:hypothetical protein
MEVDDAATKRDVNGGSAVVHAELRASAFVANPDRRR